MGQGFDPIDALPCFGFRTAGYVDLTACLEESCCELEADT